MTSVFDEVSEVLNERQGSYDHPVHNFRKIAMCWSVILDVEVTAEQVAMMMIAMKLVREAFKPKRDNLVDLLGYTRCLEQIYEYREAKAKRKLKRAQRKADEQRIASNAANSFSGTAPWIVDQTEAETVHP